MKLLHRPLAAPFAATGIILGAALLAGCAHRTARLAKPIPARPVAVVDENRPALDATWLQPPKTEFTLGPGDRLVIEVAGEPASRVETVVGPDGKVYYEMLSGIDVWGKTLSQARESLEGGLKEFYRDTPHVNLTLQEVGSKHVWVLGRIGAPGLYPLNGPTTLLDAISAAGGPAAAQSVARLSTGGTVSVADPRRNSGDLRHAFVVRDGKPLPISVERLLEEGDMTQNIYLQPDDLIYLPAPRNQEVFVLGAVNQARAVRLSGDATLVSAVAAAGGIGPDAYLSNVAVVRGGVAEPAIAVYDFKAILGGQAPDIRLEPNDIVYVPKTPYHVLTNYLDLIVTTFARTIGVNAGARVSNSNAVIAVPIGP